MLRLQHLPIVSPAETTASPEQILTKVVTLEDVRGKHAQYGADVAPHL